MLQVTILGSDASCRSHHATPDQYVRDCRAQWSPEYTIRVIDDPESEGLDAPESGVLVCWSRPGRADEIELVEVIRC